MNKPDIANMTMHPTRHFISQMTEKGFDPEAVVEIFKSPDRYYPSGKRHPGQWRITGNGMCIVGKPEGDRFVLITCYQDQVVTPVREDHWNYILTLGS